MQALQNVDLLSPEQVRQQMLLIARQQQLQQQQLRQQQIQQLHLQQQQQQPKPIVDNATQILLEERAKQELQMRNNVGCS